MGEGFWRHVFGGGVRRSDAAVQLCDGMVPEEEGRLWVAPGSARPPGGDRDLWWYRPLSLDELALVLRFVGEAHVPPIVRVVIVKPSSWAPSARRCASVLRAALEAQPDVQLSVVAEATQPRWYAALRRELHRCGVRVEEHRQHPPGASMAVDE
ncbi:hypothetical protein EA187_11430 [Lujinxingia sediminis]|uniref:Uncharacterized protein n=1 Tax=Lujinxingia sediminis TaxID=2480984 RepID=A0ABY0CTZ2_9DELT|nr:hypothetical protein EA187_11430 [Lujinxingia sediminis]